MNNDKRVRLLVLVAVIIAFFALLVSGIILAFKTGNPLALSAPAAMVPIVVLALQYLFEHKDKKE